MGPEKGALGEAKIQAVGGCKGADAIKGIEDASDGANKGNIIDDSNSVKRGGGGGGGGGG